MALTWGGTNLETTYDFFVEKVELGIPPKKLTLQYIPGSHGARIVAWQFDVTKHKIVGVFKDTVTWANFLSFENAINNSIKVFSDYDAAAPSASTMVLTHIDPSTTYPNCYIESFKILDYQPTGTLAIPLRIELNIVQNRPGKS